MKIKVSRSFSILLVILLSVSSLSILNVTAQEEDSWISMTKMSHLRKDLSLAEVDNKIYAIGGSGIGLNEMFDPNTNNWTTKTPSPTTRWNGHSTVAVYQNKIYLIGGGHAFGKICDANEAYNPVDDTWEEKTPIPNPRAGCSASTFNNKIYVFGGGWTGLNLDNPDEPLGYYSVSYNFTDVYDPNNNTWSVASPAPIELYSCQSVVFEDKIYVFSKGIIQVYDPRTDSWLSEIRTNLNVSSNARIGATSGRFAPKRIHIVDVDKHHIYDPNSDSWSDGAPMNAFRSSFGLVVVNDKLYAMGGQHEGQYHSLLSSKNEEYTPMGYGAIQVNQIGIIIALSLIAILVAGVGVFAYLRKRRS